MESGVEVLHYLKHYEEESGDQSESKVSKIATMFQVPGDLEEKDGVHGGSGPQVTVVRTESHVARFNTARALFEKMAEKNGAPEQRQSRQPQRHSGSFTKTVTPAGMGRGGVSPNRGVSLSRSPSPGAIKTGGYSNGHSPAPTYKAGGAVTPQGSSYIATITSMSSTPVATSSFYASPPSVLHLSSKKTVEPIEAARGRWPPTASHLPHKGVDGATTKDETPSGRPRPDEALQVEIHLRPEFESKHHLKNGVAGPDLVGGKDGMSASKPDLLVKCEPLRGRPDQAPGKPLKPAKPETLIDRPLSSHLHNQQIIQRHRNWFQSYSKSKAPLSPPNRTQHPTPLPASHPHATSEHRFPVELEKSSSYDNIGQVIKCRRFPVSDDELSPTKNIRSFAKEIQIHKKATDETSSHAGDWRKERAAILSGRSPRESVEEKRGKGTPPEAPKLKTFEEVPTLPSCWSPPKQYNQSAGASTTSPPTGRCPGEYEDDVPKRPRVSPEVQRDLSSVCRGLRRGVIEDTGEVPNRRSFSEGVALDDRPSPQDTPLTGGEVIWKLRDDLPGEREKRLRDWERRRGHREEVGVHSGLHGEETSRRASLPSSDAGRRTSWREDRRRAESRLLQRERSPQEKQPRSEEVRRRRLDEPNVDRGTAKRELEFFDTTTRRRDEEEEWERRRKEEKIRKRKEEEEESVVKMREVKRREEYEWRRNEKEEQEGARRKEELEKKREAELGRNRREKEESERRKRDEEMERKKSEIEFEIKRKEEESRKKEELERRKKEEELERRKKEEELERRKKEEELERRKSEELERRRLEKEELERKKREEEELIRRRREEEVLERRRRKEEELAEKKKREAELERKRKEEEELEKSRKKEAALLERRRNEEEKEREIRNREEKEMERRRNEEYERKRKAEMERRKREEEELERKRREEEEELEKKIREEELERKRKEKEMAEMRRKEEEALKRKKEEEKEEMKRKEEALEKKRKEEEEAEERRQKEELEMRRMEREETRRRLKEEEEAKRRLEEEAKRRMMEDLELERKLREKEEAERKRKEEELNRRRREEEEAERRKKEEITERRKKEEAERRRKDEDEFMKMMAEKEFNRRRREEESARQRKEEEEAERRRKEEEAERRRRKEEEAEMRRKEEEEEAERKKREEEEAERRRKEEEETERRRKEEEEAERKRKEVQEAQMKRNKEVEEAEICGREDERAKRRKEIAETEDIRQAEEAESEMRKDDGAAGRRRKEEKETDKREPARPLLEEESKKKRSDAEDQEDGRETELKNEQIGQRNKERGEGEIVPMSCSEETQPMDEDEARRWREERRRKEEENFRGELERKWQLKKEKLEEEERIRRERDRAQIEKTKRRIAELKKEREMMRRQQAIRLRKLMKAEAGEEEDDEEEEDKDDEEEFPADSQPEEAPPPSRPELRESKTVDLLAQDELTRVIPFSEFEGGAEGTPGRVEDPPEGHQSAASVSPRRSREAGDLEDSTKPTPAAGRQDGDSTRDANQDRTKEANHGPSKADELPYDHTVLSAQHKIEFCTSPYHGPATKEESCETNSMSSRSDPVFFASTISSEFEPLPPPIPPHNVDPATLASKDPSENRLPPHPVPKPESASEPEVMTPEEEEKLLSHNIMGNKRRLAEEVGETNEGKPDGAEVPKEETPENLEVDQDDVDKDYDSVCVDSPTPDEDQDPADLFTHEITEEGFVIRAKEILIEDGVHYFEDGHFWIQVPGLTDDDEDDLPDSVPVHEHTKLKFSTEPIQLFSTFSVTDYDRKNEDVDPVAASAEYELEKRVEKMDVFPVQIEKGECGLGLSIIGMGVGADAGVEKLGIFVKTITPGGATDEDGRIHVNDQIIEVDNQSLVGVTQMFAASVLKNTSGTVNFLIGRETDPENSEVAMLIRQSLLADHERDERRRALEGPNYDPRNAGIFESFSSQSGGESPSEETPRNLFSHREEEVIQYGEDFGDAYGSCPPSPIEGVSSPTPEAFNHEVMAKELMQNSDMMILSQHLEEAQHKNEMYEEEINILRCKLAQLEKDLGEKAELANSFHETTLKLKDVEDKLQSRQAEIATYQDMLEQSQGQYIILEKKYYKAKKIIKEYQNREKDFLHREEYHITQLEEKDALYNSLVKALKDRVIQLEGDLIKAQQQAGLPIKVPPDLNAQSSNFIHSNAQDNHSPLPKEPPRKPSTISTLDADLSDTEGADTHASEGSKSSTVERKIPSKEELDVAVPPTELLDNSFSKAKGELASRGGLANRQLPSLKKTSSTTSANSFDNEVDEPVDECAPESQQLRPQSPHPKSPSALLQEEVFQQPPAAAPVTSVSSPATSPSTGSHPPPPSFGSGSPSMANFGGRLPPPYHTPHTQASPAHPHHQPPPYQPPPSAPLSHRAVASPDPHSVRNETPPHRHPPPIARVQPVNRVEASPGPPSHAQHHHQPQQHPQAQQQQTLAHQLKALLAEREASSDSMHRGNRDTSPLKKSPSSLMEDVRQAVIQADMSIGKKPVISGPIHVSSTAQVVSTGQFVHSRTSPQKGSSVATTLQQRIGRDSGSWSSKLSSEVAPSTPSGGVVLLSQRPIDASLPSGQGDENEAAGNRILCTESSSFDSQHSDKSTSGISARDIISVFDWTKEQVAQWLVVQGLEAYVSTFISAGITGPRLINIDTKDLKSLGLSSDDKNKIKRKVKELRQNLEKERKQIEKENKEREKLQKKAEKLAEKAERRKK